MAHHQQTTTVIINEHETPIGTRIVCQTPVDGDNSGMSDHLSRLHDCEMVVAPSMWVFSGTGYKSAARFVIEIANLIKNRDPDTFAGFGAVALAGDQNGEPMVAIVVASIDVFDAEIVSDTARALVVGTNVLLQDGQSAIRLPLPQD